MAYLVDHPPRRRQFKNRGTKPSGVVVVHTAENGPDWNGPDGGAEGVAKFIQNRSDPGSYHDLADSDSIINLVPYDKQAYQDGTGTNPHAYAVSGATQAHRWNEAPRKWRRATVRNMALAASRYAKWIKKHHGITIPARRITRAQSDNRVPGFISHAERDPSRRSDPGAAFPWELFLDFYKEFMGEKPEEPKMNHAQKGKRALADALADLRVSIAELRDTDEDREVTQNVAKRLREGPYNDMAREYDLLPDK